MYARQACYQLNQYDCHEDYLWTLIKSRNKYVQSLTHRFFSRIYLSGGIHAMFSDNKNLIKTAKLGKCPTTGDRLNYKVAHNQPLQVPNTWEIII